ncbi:vWA domain-containing protein [Streptomyces sp. SAI-149]|uniref:vWA domain-containing protein n=1 Tax=Streptomyces sp. SAI-149 TaxID=2940542 RepID=UPI0024730E4B|nr:vWA domain-containing protein [Streptomyces sp. SAI-149]
MAGVFALAMPLSGAPSASPMGKSERGADPIDFAVVVDASPSVPAEALQEEKEATALLAQGEIATGSRGMVLVFGGADDSGNAAVNEVCPLTKLDAGGRQRLGDCVKSLNREKIGAGTDFPSAIRQASSRLAADSSPGTPKIMFLLTDGKLDVRDDPAYGPDASRRQANGEKALTGALQQARSTGVQVWPLGFGKGVEKSALNAMARGGYQNACAGLPEATPHARTVNISADVDTALLQTFAGARCAHLTEGTSRRPSGDLHVTLPSIATSAAIIVIKRDPTVTVNYSDPQGTKIPRNQVSGPQNTVEGLQIRQHPAPGEWTAHIDASPGHQDQKATIGAIWQGVVDSYIDVQREVQKGEKIPVRVQLQNKQGVPVTDLPQAYDGRVSVRLTGQSIKPISAQLEDTGREPDSESGDGQFGGYLQVPRSAHGKLAVTSTVTAPGITGDSRPVTIIVIDKPPFVVSASGVLDQQTVQPGGTVSGTLQTTNTDSKPHELRLVLQDSNKAVPSRISPVIVSVPAGSSHESHKFGISVSDRAPKDQMVGGRVIVIDSTDGNKQLESVFVGAEVKPPPPPYEPPWKLIATLCVVGMLILLFSWDRYRRWLNPAGLQVALFDKGEERAVYKSQPVLTGQKGPYSFMVTGDEIKPGRSGKESYQIHRWLPKGRLKIKNLSSGVKQEVHDGQPYGIANNRSIVPSYRRSPIRPTGPENNTSGTTSGKDGDF